MSGGKGGRRIRLGAMSPAFHPSSANDLLCDLIKSASLSRPWFLPLYTDRTHEGRAEHSSISAIMKKNSHFVFTLTLKSRHY